MEGGVEARDLRHRGAPLGDRLEDAKLGGEVQRRERNERVERGDQPRVDASRGGPLGAPVHDPVPHGLGERVATAFQFVEELPRRGRVIADRRADALDTPARDFALAARVDVEESVLQRRGAAVDGEDPHALA